MGAPQQANSANHGGPTLKRTDAGFADICISDIL
jgi:hypothetical protein